MADNMKRQIICRYSKNELLSINQVSNKTKMIPKCFMDTNFCFEHSTQNREWNPETYWKFVMNGKNGNNNNKRKMVNNENNRIEKLEKTIKDLTQKVDMLNDTLSKVNIKNEARLDESGYNSSFNSSNMSETSYVEDNENICKVCSCCKNTQQPAQIQMPSQKFIEDNMRRIYQAALLRNKLK